MYIRKMDSNPYAVIANHVRMKTKKALLKSFVMAAKIKKTKPKSIGNPVNRKNIPKIRSCFISRRKTT
jgi:hypothetical protein